MHLHLSPSPLLDTLLTLRCLTPSSGNPPPSRQHSPFPSPHPPPRPPNLAYTR